MFLKIIKNNLQWMNSTTVYEMDNIEYFSLPLWQVTYTNWENQVKARKEYAHNISYLREDYPHELEFVRQMNPLAKWSAHDSQITYNEDCFVTRGSGKDFDELGVKRLIDWAYSWYPHWFNLKDRNKKIPVLLYIDRNPIQLYDSDLYHMPYIYFIKLTQKNPEEDSIIITNMHSVYLQSDDGKTIEKLSKKINLTKEDKETEMRLKQDYFTKEYFEYKHTKLYDPILKIIENPSHSFFASSSTSQEKIDKKIKEREEILKPYWKTVEEINNKYNPPEAWETSDNTEEDEIKNDGKKG